MYRCIDVCASYPLLNIQPLRLLFRSSLILTALLNNFHSSFHSSHLLSSSTQSSSPTSFPYMSFSPTEMYTTPFPSEEAVVTGSQTTLEYLLVTSSDMEWIDQRKVDADEYSEGGPRAWLVISGAWCLLFVSSGWINYRRLSSQ